MAVELPRNQFELLRYLSGAGTPAMVPDISSATGIDQSLVAAAVVALDEAGLIDVEETPFDEVSLREAGRAWVDSGELLPEFRIREVLDREGPLALPDVAKQIGSDPTEIGKSLRFLFSKGLARKDKSSGALTPQEGDAPQADSFDDVKLLGRLVDAEGEVRLEADESKKLGKVLSELRSREFIKVRGRTERHISLTEKGREIAASGVTERKEKNMLEPEMLADGSWREITFRPYDVTADTAPAYPAKPHPLRRILEETRRAFHYLGFEEIRGPYVESAFWDFDALFQPQDHPAREMQDTFYVERPGKFSLPERDIVEKIRAIHQDGGDTGSTGWGYQWSDVEAQRVVLRTHTTAATVIALKEDPKPPRKVFLVGRVFRREKTDYKHLPEFHQVDGIIIDDKASLAALIGTITKFYNLMGFESVKVRPSFFPYTEPSMEVFVRMPGRETDWFELGGSGMFRPEVAKPFGCEVPVLAWGLGLERLAMARYGMTDIRKLYMSDIDWLEETPLCL